MCKLTKSVLINTTDILVNVVYIKWYLLDKMLCMYQLCKIN